MENKEKFLEVFQDAVEKVKKIEGVYNVQNKNLRKLFNMCFSDNSNAFDIIRDFLYYTDGMPKDSSVAKLDKLFGSIVIILKYFKLLGYEDRYIKYFEKYNIEIEVKDVDVNMKDLESLKDSEDFKMLWQEVLNEVNIESQSNVLDIVKIIIDNALDVKNNINIYNNVVKDSYAKVIEEECCVNKGAFVDAVNARAKNEMHKDVTKYYKKVEDSAIIKEYV
jgi:hypothetical protein